MTGRREDEILLVQSLVFSSSRLLLTDPRPDAVTTPVGVTTLCPQCGASMPAFETRCNACGHQRPGGTEQEQREELKRRLQKGVGDAYELMDMLGKGGMGIVFRAREKSLDREVALKVLAFDPLMVPEAFARFEREAKLAARLDHPHIVPIFAVGQGSGIAFYTMRLVRGGSLEELLAKEKRLVPDRAIRYLREIASALDHAHKNGVVHRDIKPANVMLGDGDHVFVADFGIARAVEGGGTALTSSGVVGSPAYMSPEQWQGHAVDGRADQYAFGILAYELLTGRRPYRDATMHELLRLHLTEDLPDISQDLSEATTSMRDALRRATAKDPAERFATTGEFVGALEGTVPVGRMPSPATLLASSAPTMRASAPAASTSVPATVASAKPAPRPAPVRKRSRAQFAALVAFAGVAVAAVMWNNRNKNAAAPPVAPTRTDTVVVNQQAPPETIRVAAAPPETIRIGQATSGTPATNATQSTATLPGAAPAATGAATPAVAPGYIVVGHPMVQRGEVRIDNTPTLVAGPPVAMPVAPGPHVVSFRSPTGRSFPERVTVGVRSGDTTRVFFVPAEGGGALGDSLRRQAVEMLRRINSTQGGLRNTGRGRRGFPPRRDTLNLREPNY